MAERTQVELELIALTKKAQADVSKFTDSTQKQLSSISMSSSITAISSGFLAVESIASKVFNSVTGFIGKAIDEANEAERGQQRLANAMRLTGDYSAEAAAEMADFANSLSATTLNSDDQVVSSLALAKSFQLTNREAKEVAKAAAELAAVTGQDLNSATNALAKSYNGFVDKSLKQLIPELRTLTEEQLANGDAVRIVAERFGGSATNAVNTFEGSITQLGKATGNLYESFGLLITRSDATKGFFKQVADDINALSEAIDGGKLSNLFFNLQVGEGFADAAKRLKDIEENAVDAEQAIKNAMRANTKTGDTAAAERQIKAQRELNVAREKALEEFNSIRSKLEMAGLSDIEKINRETQKNISIVQKALSTGAISDRIKAQKQIESLRIDGAMRVSEIEKKILEKQLADELKLREDAFNKQKAIVSKVGSSPLTGFLPERTANDQKTFSNGQETQIAQIAGGLNSFLKGAEGAKELLKNAAASVGDFLVPGLGPVIGEIAGALAQGPDFVRQQVTEFARAIPQLIENLAQSLPVLIETLVRELPPALAKAMPTVAFGFSVALIKNIPNIVKGFAQGLIDAAKQAGQALIDMIKDIPGDIFGGISGKDSGGIFEGVPILGGIGDVFGFAEGGRVPDLSQYRGDRFPARLNAGEQVLDRDLSQELENFLQGSGGGQPQTAIFNIQMGLETFARLALECDRRGFRLRAV